MKTTQYFESIRTRPERAMIRPERETVYFPRFDNDNSIKKNVSQIEEMENRYLRVILLGDGETVHNAFFDRGFKP